MNTPFADNVKATLDRLRAEIVRKDVDLGEKNAALRTLECERQKALDDAAELRTRLLLAEQTIARLELAAPVMLTAMAFVADEADADGMREIVAWYDEHENDHLALWLDAEHRNQARAAEVAMESSGG